MSNSRNVALIGAATAAMIFVASPTALNIASASTQHLREIEPVASEPVALYITLCLWSEQRPKPMCHELPLTPGAAGPLFVSMKACQDGQGEAVGRWREQAGPVFGFTAMAGDGYRIDGMRCSPVADSQGP